MNYGAVSQAKLLFLHLVSLIDALIRCRCSLISRFAAKQTSASV